MKRAWQITTLIFICCCLTPAYADEWAKNIYEEYGLSNEDIEMRLNKMQRHLNLSDKQHTRLREIFSRFDQEMKQLMAQQKENEKKIMSLLQQGKLDDEMLQKLANVLGDLKAKITVLKYKNRMDTYATLSQEQRQKFSTYWRRNGQWKKPDSSDKPDKGVNW